MKRCFFFWGEGRGRRGPSSRFVSLAPCSQFAPLPFTNTRESPPVLSFNSPRPHSCHLQPPPSSTRLLPSFQTTSPGAVIQTFPPSPFPNPFKPVATSILYLGLEPYLCLPVKMTQQWQRVGLSGRARGR